MADPWDRYTHLAYPNREQRWHFVKCYWYLEMALYGRAYLWEIKDSSGQVSQVWPLPVSWLFARPDGSFSVRKPGSKGNYVLLSPGQVWESIV